jgi:transketolase
MKLCLIKIKKDILISSFKAKACHIGSALSCVEILYSLYNILKKKDYFIFSKASGASALYAILAYKKYFSKKKLAYFLKKYPLANKKVPGILHSVGSIGHGLGVAVGIAFVNRKRRVYCLISDGELNEGSTWEALLFAGHYKLNNLTVILDNNKLQACGYTNDILCLNPLSDKFRSFNWTVERINGHNIEELNNAFTKTTNNPMIIIADTVKGNGIDFLENSIHSHYQNLDKLTLQKALCQI